MLRIRLQRVGRIHESHFRVVLTESQNSTKTGRVQEVLGSYDPRDNNPTINADRVNYWISVGAKPTDTMHNLLVTKGIIKGKKINVLPKKSAPVKVEEPVKEEAKAPVAETETPAEAPEVAEAPAEEVAVA